MGKKGGNKKGLHQPTRIKEFRQAAGLTQQKLAALAGTTSQTISRLERGIVSYRQGRIEDIAKALGRTVPELLSKNADELAELPEEVWRAWKRADKKQRKRIINILKASFDLDE